MCTFARINDFGFIETPYRKVENGRVTDKIDYLTADREENFIVAQANAPIDEKGHFTSEKVICPLPRRLPRSRAGARSTTWTSRRSSSSPSPPA